MTCSLGILLCVAVLLRTSQPLIMDKLADSKICADAECSCKSTYDRASKHIKQYMEPLKQLLNYHFIIRLLARPRTRPTGIKNIQWSRLQRMGNPKFSDRLLNTLVQPLTLSVLLVYFRCPLIGHGYKRLRAYRLQIHQHQGRTDGLCVF